MICPWCDNDTNVIDSRPTEEGQVTRRRRKCKRIKNPHRFSTYEIFDGDYDNLKKMNKFIEMMHYGLNKLEEALIK